MLLYTAQDMKNTEAAANDLGHGYAEMMRRAGQGAARLLLQHFDLVGRSCVVFCGRGNNGGDGYVAADWLRAAGVAVVAVALEGPPTTPHALHYYNMAVQSGLSVMDWREEQVEALCANAALVVDALCGTGFHGNLRENARICCARMNAAACPVAALDMPTGVCADDGTAAEGSVEADLTITFHRHKPGQLILPGRTHCGEVVCTEIGIADAACHPAQEFVYVDRDYVAQNIPPRPAECNKGSFGRLLAVVGSRKYMGAALLAIEGALRSGAGYVQLGSTDEVCGTLLPSVPESLMLRCPADGAGGLDEAAAGLLVEQAQKASALLVGCGLGTAPGAARVVQRLLAESTAPVVLDADGINLAAGNIEWIKKRRCQLILTPHPAEFGRLLGCSTAQVLANRLSLGRGFAAEYGVTLLLKGSCTMVFAPDGRCCLVDAGTPGLAKAGSGDVLAGLIGGLLAQGLGPECAAACGAWLHGRAGSLAAKRHSLAAMLPRDVAEHLGEAFLECGR